MEQESTQRSVLVNQMDVFGIEQRRNCNNNALSCLKSTAIIRIGGRTGSEKSVGKMLSVYENFQLYKELDSIYGNFEQAVTLNFEVEAISKLEYSAAKNQVFQIQNKKRRHTGITS